MAAAAAAGDIVAVDIVTAVVEAVAADIAAVDDGNDYHVGHTCVDVVDVVAVQVLCHCHHCCQLI